MNKHCYALDLVIFISQFLIVLLIDYITSYKNKIFDTPIV